MVRRKEWMTQFLKPHSKTEDDDQKGCDISESLFSSARVTPSVWPLHIIITGSIARSASRRYL